MARAISLIENGGPMASKLLSDVFPETGDAFVIGITGPSGTGKSTLVDRLIDEYRARGATVGVLAVDPTSPFTGGALLGDRVRMVKHSLDKGVFIRSMASRGAYGGLAYAARNVVRLFDAAGIDVILIETMGIGQSEVEVIRVADAVVVVLMPESGDEVQTLKAGLMEIGDIYVVNKADLPGADRAFLNLKRAIVQRFGWTPPVLKTVARTGKGVPELVGELNRFRDHLVSSGLHEQRLQERARSELLHEVVHALLEDVATKVENTREFETLVAKIATKKLAPQAAARRLVRKLTRGDAAG